jgi:putative DNA primase/helicase
MNATAFNDRFNNAEPINIWPAPDMSILSSGRRAPPTMPKEVFGPIWPMLEDMAQGAGAPVDYLGISFLAVAASLIGGRRRIKPYEGADWSEPCILWAGLVGDPSSAKSPALDRTTNVLREMERSHADNHAELIKGWKADCERSKAEWATYQANDPQRTLAVLSRLNL